ncbi:MAG: hypothetical protein V8S27_04350 [Lachnospiraceae bacterium]|mgnify:FL=1
MAVYKSSSGKVYTLGAQLGTGGEGIVSEIQGENSKVAKIYKADRFKTDQDRFTMERKLKAMLDMNISVYVDGKLRLAWPLDILYENGSMVGFVMPKINSKYKIFDVQRVEMAEKIYPNYTWKYAVQFAYNLSVAVKYVHDKNIVIGDFNQNNISIDTSTGAVILIDCDSFDIRDPKSGEHFPCKVGLPEMLAPELQTVRNLANGTFTKETDNFSLAIHIFRLLMRNEDPFGGVITMSRSLSTVSANAPIINGECPYVRTVSGKEIPGRSPTLDMLPVNIQELFKKTFDYDASTALRRIKNRATATEWCNALVVLATAEPNPNLQTCTLNPHHVYPKYSSYCPWCRCENYQPPKPQPSVPQGRQRRAVQSTSTINSTVNSQVTYTPPNSGTVNILSGITGVSGRTGATGMTTNQQAGSGGNSKPRRTSTLFYLVLIAFGLAGGFVFGQPVCEVADLGFHMDIPLNACIAVLSIGGVIGSALIAYYFKDRYIYADNAIPWLFMGLVTLLVPLVVALAMALVMFIVAVILGILTVFVSIIIGIIVIVMIGSGS